MAENDIYNNKRRYERAINGFEDYLEKPKKKSKRTYYIKNPINLQYFYKLIPYFEARDQSYIRRCRLFQVMRLICFVVDKDLAEADRDDINKIMAHAQKTHSTIKSKQDLVKNIKCLWKALFPEKDVKGRIDDTIVPYPVRHLSRKIDKSLQKRRNDKLSIKEFQQIIQYFAPEPQIQAYLMFAYESLGRPQEILYTKVKDYEFFDNYAKVWISEHGKEGCGLLQCIDSYPFIANWYSMHPFKNDSDSFFFLSKDKSGRYRQLSNISINKKLRNACDSLRINKTVTCYSIKRNGVTHRKLRGESDMQIQHVARWTSTRQMQFYDYSTQEDAFKQALESRGLKAKREVEEMPMNKDCSFCGFRNGFTADHCSRCFRILDREKIQEQADKHDKVMSNSVLQRFDRMEKLMAKMMNHSL